MENERKEHRLVSIDLCATDLRDICGRYHFGDIGFPLLMEIYKKYFKNNMVSAYFAWSKKETDRASVLMTLGKKVDDIQNRFMEEGRLSEAYMMECIATEQLAKAYAKGDDFLHEKTGLWCGKYEFPGTERPMEDIAEIVDAFDQEEIFYNAAYVLMPKKSVAYTVLMQEEEPDMRREQALCTGCGREGCERRMMNSEE